MIHKIILSIFSLLLLSAVFCKATKLNSYKIEKEKNMRDSIPEKKQPIAVLELRNYLLKHNTLDAFENYFNKHFVEPMTALGGYTLGQFKINGVGDRFVWLRGFTDMQARLKFLNDFYLQSPAWKNFGPEANEMMLNSDNVYLLRPLNMGKGAATQTEGVSSAILQTNKRITVVDFYTCNSRLSETINFFKTTYLPFLKTISIEDITFWVSEMRENDFPRLPVFQDKNLLVSITNYKDEKEYLEKQKELDALPEILKNTMLEKITTHNKLLLINTMNNHSVTLYKDTLVIPKLKFGADGELEIAASPSSSEKDFDFFVGKSSIRNRKLKSRLNGCTDWNEFEATGEMYKVLNGIGNIDNFIATINGQTFEGMTLRLFNPKTRLWSIYWADSNEGKLDQPVVGSFENKVGHFFCKDSFNGKNVVVVFRWDARDKDHPVWSQAFSEDNGKPGNGIGICL